MIVFNPSPLIAFRDPDDRHHRRTVELLDFIADQEWLIHSVKLAAFWSGP